MAESSQTEVSVAGETHLAITTIGQIGRIVIYIVGEVSRTVVNNLVVVSNTPKKSNITIADKYASVSISSLSQEQLIQFHKESTPPDLLSRHHHHCDVLFYHSH
jgi:hypothetical protein